MKTWFKRTLIGLAGASVLFGGIAACSQRHHDRGWHAVSAEDAAKWRERFVDRAARELELDAAQREQLGAVFDRLREQRNAMIGTTTDPRAELRALIGGERFDAARAQALIEQKAAALRDGSPQTIASLAAFYDGLKPEQQAKLRALLDRRHRHWS